MHQGCKESLQLPRVSYKCLGQKQKQLIIRKSVMSEHLGVKVMANHRGADAQKMLSSIATLLRNTTWKCGKIERRVVNYLQRIGQRSGNAQTPVKEMMQEFELSGKQKSEFIEAIRRLEKRNIIKISWPRTPSAAM